jgi:hypothetical protein
MPDRRSLTVAAFGLLAALAACGRGAPDTSPGAPRAKLSRAPRNGLEVIGWMRQTHPSRDLKSLAFTVRAIRYVNDSTQLRSRAYAALPGRMRVENLPKSTRTGYVRDRQRLAVFRAGQRVSTVNRVDLRTLLAYDVFAQGIDTTVMWLDSARVRFALLRRAKFEGRSVWVVGADADDTVSPQFWVDAETWRLLRVIQREPRSPSVISDVRYTEFTELLDIPVPTHIEVWREGKLVEQQELSDFSVNPALPRTAFDLARWRSVSLGN